MIMCLKYLKNLVFIYIFNEVLSSELVNYYPELKSVYISQQNSTTRTNGTNDNDRGNRELSNTTNSQGETETKGPEEDTFKNLIEEKYKFQNDETSRRYKISDEGNAANKNEKKDREIAWAFRSFAARRIVGGMETSISMYPYNVAISRLKRHWCGGSVIDEQWILTAGHCMESVYDGGQYSLTPFIIRAGSSTHDRGGYQAKVNKVFFPSKYKPGDADYDYALVRLDRPLPIGRNIAVLNLPSTDFRTNEQDILLVTGWGSTDVQGFGHIPDRLRFVPVPIISNEVCQKSYRFHITPRMMCAGYPTGGRDACNHDSGGPAVRDGVLLGVVSFGGKRCGDPSSPGVYSRVTEITEWVEDTVTNNEASTVPELRERIEKSRLRERELQKFKAHVEAKKNKIKNWLKETLQSANFLELAKKKLKDFGFVIREFSKHFRRSGTNDTMDMDEKEMDEVNLSNLIHETIIEAGGENNEPEKLLRTLAMQEVMLSKDKDLLELGSESFKEDTRKE